MKFMYLFEIACLLITFGCVPVSASVGDQTTFFTNCQKRCSRENCTSDGIEILPIAKEFYDQSIFDRLLGWTCLDECKYFCMWKTVKAFIDRKWAVPQFYGKWPFKKVLGLQEPASVFFSIMNLVTNIVLLRKFRREVRSDSPCYTLWHIFAFVNINGWIWSTVYHARDLNITELLDYVFAYSIILVNFYSMVIRMLHTKSLILRGIITSSFVTFFFHYFTYLSDGHLNYGTNMQLNIGTALLSGLGWLLWCLVVRKRRPYYWKILLFYILVGLSSCLEILDFPPYFWTFDAHSLWHFCSIPATFLLYNFIIDDCKTLRKEMVNYELLNKTD